MGYQRAIPVIPHFSFKIAANLRERHACALRLQSINQTNFSHSFFTKTVSPNSKLDYIRVVKSLRRCPGTSLIAFRYTE